MLHEKPNESFHWKNKLDELDHLPGEPMPDKTAAWEKLHDRLFEIPRHKKVVWYWVAAASLIILIVGIQWIMMKQKDDVIVNNKLQPKQEQSSKVPRMVKEDPIVNPMQVADENKQKLPVIVKNKNHHPSLIQTVLKVKTVVTNPDTTKKSLPEIIAGTLQPPDTIAIIVAAPIKKKLRVVHINELGKPVLEEIQFARNTSSPVFQAKLFNQDGFSNISLSRNASDNILKIKLSPSN